MTGRRGWLQQPPRGREGTRSFRRAGRDAGTRAPLRQRRRRGLAHGVEVRRGRPRRAPRVTDAPPRAPLLQMEEERMESEMKRTKALLVAQQLFVEAFLGKQPHHKKAKLVSSAAAAAAMEEIDV